MGKTAVRAIIGILAALGAVALSWMCYWLQTHRSFIDPTLLSKEAALTVQAAWVQAILSVLAVFVAVAVAFHQSKLSRALSEEQHKRSLELLTAEWDRAAAIESERAAERQALAARVLQQLLDDAKVVADVIQRGRIQDWTVPVQKMKRIAEHTKSTFDRVTPMLAVSPSAALSCFIIGELVERLGSPWAEVLSDVTKQDAAGNRIPNYECTSEDRSIALARLQVAVATINKAVGKL